jgi:hypothetical protein
VIDGDGAVGDEGDVRVWLSKPPCCSTEEKIGKLKKSKGGDIFKVFPLIN